MIGEMSFHTVFFDLDATLYPESNGLWPAISQRIDLYMRQHLGIPAEQTPTMRRELYLRYGTTLKGLLAHYEFDSKEYLDFVHDLPLEDYLHPDAELRAMLTSIPARRWVLTNSDHRHAQRVLNHLGIADCFDGVIDVWALDPYCKPQPEAYLRALDIVGAERPQDCALLEDSPANLRAAREMGFFTILVNLRGEAENDQRVITDIHQLRAAAPELWNHAR